MLTTDQRNALIDKLRACPPLVRSAAAGLDDQQLDTTYRDGGWTVRQVVHHIADSHVNGYLRFKWVVAEDFPTIKTYDQDVWAGLPDSKLPLDCSLVLLEALHERWSALLSRLPESAWSRRAMHPENGNVSLDDLLETYANHGAHHAGQITDLRKRKGW